MDNDDNPIADTEKLLLSNTVSLSALVGILIRKGLIQESELVEEIRLLKSRIGARTED